jgi:unsaturated rhamnogalacturonyl hydrolase
VSRFAAGLLFAVGLGCGGPAHAAEPVEFGGAKPLTWSERMAASEMARRGDSLFLGGSPRAKLDYTTSLFGLSLLKLAERTGDAAMADYGAKTVESFVRPDGSLATFRSEALSLDEIPPGKVLLFRWEHGRRDARFRKAIETIRAQLDEQPRTSEGGFWHKQRYPSQMWLDGVFMASPFLAQYGAIFHQPAAFDDVANQILLIDRHAYDPKTGLHYHAWDEKRAQSWANPETGDSPNFWGRAEGWYAMALVDSLEFLPADHPAVPRIKDVLRRVADGIVRWQDPPTGVWWQILDQGGREGNYREATCSSMFVYALAKAVNRGWLPRATYAPAIERGYAGLIREFVRDDGRDRVSLTHCCEVAGLGYTNSAGRPRDGTFEYYVSEPVIDNDLKGVGPFILAGLEVSSFLAPDAAAGSQP